MVRWVVENNIMSEENYDSMIRALMDLNVEFDTVVVKPFEHTIVGIEPKPENPVVVYGSIGLQKLAMEKMWIPGVWAGAGFNESHAAMAYGKLYLNPDVEIMKMSQVMGRCQWNEFFIKPNADTKQFAGQVINKKNFKSWYQGMKDSGDLDENDFEVAISSPKETSEEVRCVVVDGKFVAGSTYKKYGITYKRPIKPGTEDQQKFRMFCEHAVSMFEPAPVFVIDFASTPDGWKIIELNSFNSAGWYSCDPVAIIQAVNAYVDSTFSYGPSNG